DLPDGVVDVEPDLRRVGFLHQRSNALDDLTRSVPVADDAAHGHSRLIEIRTGPREPAPAGIGAGDDRRERLVELLFDGCHQFSHRHDPRDMSQLSLGVLQGFLGLLALRDVHDCSHELDPAGLMCVGTSDNANVSDRPVGHQQATFMIEVLAIARRATDGLSYQSGIFRMTTLERQPLAWLRRSVVSENPKCLLRPQEFARRDVPPETARLAQSLRFSEERLAAPQFGGLLRHFRLELVARLAKLEL